MVMSFKFDEMKILILMLLGLPLITATNIDCNGKAFHCVNTTHFMICVDFGSGVSKTLDDYVIPCPPTTGCQASNRYECEYLPVTTTVSQVLTSEVNNEVTETANTLAWEPISVTTNGQKSNEVEHLEKYFNTLNISTLPSELTQTIDVKPTEAMTSQDTNIIAKATISNDVTTETTLLLSGIQNNNTDSRTEINIKTTVTIPSEATIKESPYYDTENAFTQSVSSTNLLVGDTTTTVDLAITSTESYNVANVIDENNTNITPSSYLSTENTLKLNLNNVNKTSSLSDLKEISTIDKTVTLVENNTNTVTVLPITTPMERSTKTIQELEVTTDYFTTDNTINKTSFENKPVFTENIIPELNNTTSSPVATPSEIFNVTPETESTKFLIAEDIDQVNKTNEVANQEVISTIYNNFINETDTTEMHDTTGTETLNVKLSAEVVTSYGAGETNNNMIITTTTPQVPTTIVQDVETPPSSFAVDVDEVNRTSPILDTKVTPTVVDKNLAKPVALNDTMAKDILITSLKAPEVEEPTSSFVVDVDEANITSPILDTEVTPTVVEKNLAKRVTLNDTIATDILITTVKAPEAEEPTYFVATETILVTSPTTVTPQDFSTIIKDIGVPASSYVTEETSTKFSYTANKDYLNANRTEINDIPYFTILEEKTTVSQITASTEYLNTKNTQEKGVSTFATEEKNFTSTVVTAVKIPKNEELTSTVIKDISGDNNFNILLSTLPMDVFTTVMTPELEVQGFSSITEEQGNEMNITSLSSTLTTEPYIAFNETEVETSTYILETNETADETNSTKLLNSTTTNIITTITVPVTEAISSTIDVTNNLNNQHFATNTPSESIVLTLDETEPTKSSWIEPIGNEITLSESNNDMIPGLELSMQISNSTSFTLLSNAETTENILNVDKPKFKVSTPTFIPKQDISNDTTSAIFSTLNTTEIMTTESPILAVEKIMNENNFSDTTENVGMNSISPKSEVQTFDAEEKTNNISSYVHLNNNSTVTITIESEVPTLDYATEEKTDKMVDITVLSNSLATSDAVLESQTETSTSLFMLTDQIISSKMNAVADISLGVTNPETVFKTDADVVTTRTILNDDNTFLSSHDKTTQTVQVATKPGNTLISDPNTRDIVTEDFLTTKGYIEQEVMSTITLNDFNGGITQRDQIPVTENVFVLSTNEAEKTTTSNFLYLNESNKNKILEENHLPKADIQTIDTQVQSSVQVNNINDVLNSEVETLNSVSLSQGDLNMNSTLSSVKPSDFAVKNNDTSNSVTDAALFVTNPSEILNSVESALPNVEIKVKNVIDNLLLDHTNVATKDPNIAVSEVPTKQYHEQIYITSTPKPNTILTSSGVVESTHTLPNTDNPLENIILNSNNAAHSFTSSEGSIMTVSSISDKDGSISIDAKHSVIANEDSASYFKQTSTPLMNSQNDFTEFASTHLPKNNISTQQTVTGKNQLNKSNFNIIDENQESGSMHTNFESRTTLNHDNIIIETKLQDTPQKESIGIKEQKSVDVNVNNGNSYLVTQDQLVSQVTTVTQETDSQLVLNDYLPVDRSHTKNIVGAVTSNPNSISKPHPTPQGSSDDFKNLQTKIIKSSVASTNHQNIATSSVQHGKIPEKKLEDKKTTPVTLDSKYTTANVKSETTNTVISEHDNKLTTPTSRKSSSDSIITNADSTDSKVTKTISTQINYPKPTSQIATELVYTSTPKANFDTMFSTSIPKTTESTQPSSEVTIANKPPFNCFGRFRGRYADQEDCGRYYVCIGLFYPIVGKCPMNTVFSDIHKQCTKNLSHCIRGSEFQCISEGRYGDIYKNNIYYICVTDNAGKFYRFKLQCQNGHNLNKTSMRCMENKIAKVIASESLESVSNNESDRSFSKNTSKEEKEKEKFKCQEEGRFPYPGNCRKYYECKKKKSGYRRKTKKCDSDETFHKEKKKCVDAESYDCE